MPLIEGVGDEVTAFFITTCVLLIGWIAWCSTNISEQPLIRTVLILQHRTRSRLAELRSNNQTISTITTIVGSVNDGTIRRLSSEANTSEENVETNIVEAQQQACSSEPANASSQIENDNNPSADVSTVATEEVLIGAMDSLNDDDTNNIISTNDKIKKSTENISSKSSNSTAESSSPIDNVDNNNSVNDDNDDDNEITIKLKYINDDQKIVRAKPKELVGNFIRRNFQVELNAQKRIRLIFNGHVLHPDNDTLEQCGLYDNCVVHCLVHQQRIQQSNNDTSSVNDSNTSSIYTGNQEFQNIQNPNGLTAVHNEWDLGRLLVSILTLILVFAWYSRYHYDQLFTVTTSLALYVLTAIFTLSVVGQVFQDQDTLRNIE